MNRAVKIILAIAIAILFPIVIGLTVFLVYPYSRTNFNRTSVSYPNTKICYKTVEVQSNKITPNSTTPVNTPTTTTYKDQACLDRIESNYRQAVAQADKEYKENVTKLNKATEKRIIVAIIAAILGFLLAFASFKYTPIAAGLSAGSMVIVLVSSGFYSGIIKDSGSVIVLLYLACFVVLIAMFVFADNYFPDLPKEESPETNNSKITPQDQPKVPPATPSNK